MTGPIDPELETVLYRVAQEAVAGAAERASGCLVQLDADGTAVRLVVSDDGSGLPSGDPTRGRPGLAALRERVELAGGRCEIQSRPGRGTSVRATFPRSAASRAAPGRGRP